MGLHVVVIGDVINGFRIVGPFNNADEAVDWAEGPGGPDGDEDWHVVQLEAPGDSD